MPPLPVPPLPFVDVVVVFVDVVAVVEIVLVVVGVVVVGGAVVVVVVVGVVVVGVVVVGTVVDEEDVVVVLLLPLSEAMTTTAMIRPMTAATSTAIAHLTPRLMPPVGGCPRGGGGGSCPMCRVGSSCTGRECTDPAGR